MLYRSDTYRLTINNEQYEWRPLALDMNELEAAESYQTLLKILAEIELMQDKRLAAIFEIMIFALTEGEMLTHEQAEQIVNARKATAARNKQRNADKPPWRKPWEFEAMIIAPEFFW